MSNKPAFYVHFIRPDFRTCNPDPEENCEVPGLGEGSVIFVYDTDLQLRACYQYDENWPKLPAWVKSLRNLITISVSANAWGNLQEYDQFDYFTHDAEAMNAGSND